MIDTHCHIHDKQFDADRDEVVARAFEAGVSCMLTIGEDVADSRRAIEIAEPYEISVAVGIHPHEAKNALHDIAEELTPLLDAPGVIAIGETGLDYYYDHSPRDRQAAVLRAQIRLARDRSLPVVFHHRDAFEDFTAILREEWSRTMRGVVHCFTGTAPQARTFIDEFGLYLGIGGVLTFPNADGLRQAVVAAGAQKLVLETDCPYLAPVPVRGKRNEPSFVAHTAAKLSATLGMHLDELVGITDENARRLFEL
ncbi:MAG: TatD family hydrolase [Candidatus Eremiobacteraeota bacterium]|nr:TatD family hydrolase [Candidatus Eremiobacteraeota bacterium]